MKKTSLPRQYKTDTTQSLNHPSTMAASRLPSLGSKRSKPTKSATSNNRNLLLSFLLHRSGPPGKLPRRKYSAASLSESSSSESSSSESSDSDISDCESNAPRLTLLDLRRTSSGATTPDIKESSPVHEEPSLKGVINSPFERMCQLTDSKIDDHFDSLLKDAKTNWETYRVKMITYNRLKQYQEFHRKDSSKSSQKSKSKGDTEIEADITQLHLELKMLEKALYKLLQPDGHLTPELKYRKWLVGYLQIIDFSYRKQDKLISELETEFETQDLKKHFIEQHAAHQLKLRDIRCQKWSSIKRYYESTEESLQKGNFSFDINLSSSSSHFSRY